jgi:N-acetylglutamate synthase-like GNAT family acetyltransferase
LTLDDQPDLLDVPGYYMNGGGNFWVAVTASERIVGCIGLQRLSDTVGVLKKFFVSVDYRGPAHRYSGALFSTLKSFAAAHHMSQIILDSPAVATRSHRFYERMGFRRVTVEQLRVPYDFVDRNSHLYLLQLSDRLLEPPAQ